MISKGFVKEYGRQYQIRHYPDKTEVVELFKNKQWVVLEPGIKKQFSCLYVPYYCRLHC